MHAEPALRITNCSGGTNRGSLPSRPVRPMAGKCDPFHPARRRHRSTQRQPLPGQGSPRRRGHHRRDGPPLTPPSIENSPRRKLGHQPRLRLARAPDHPGRAQPHGPPCARRQKPWDQLRTGGCNASQPTGSFVDGVPLGVYRYACMSHPTGTRCCDHGEESCLRDGRRSHCQHPPL